MISICFLYIFTLKILSNSNKGIASPYLICLNRNRSCIHAACYVKMECCYCGKYFIYILKLREKVDTTGKVLNVN